MKKVCEEKIYICMYLYEQDYEYLYKIIILYSRVKDMRGNLTKNWVNN